MYLVATIDFKLHIFNDLLEYVGFFHHKMRLLRFVEIETRSDTLIVGGIEGAFHLKVDWNRKYDAMASLKFDPLGNSLGGSLSAPTKFAESLPWL